MECCERVSMFVVLILFLTSMALVVSSLLTEFWFEADVVNDKIGIAHELSRVHAGLFHGVREIDYGLGSRNQGFNVLSEIQAGLGFMSKLTWIFILFFIALGLLWLFIGVIVALMNLVAKRYENVAGPIGIYLWSFLALLSLSSATLIYYIQYATTIKENVLLEDQLQSGFSSRDQTRLGFSFYLMLGALLCLYVPPLLIYLSSNHCRKAQRQKPVPFDPTAMLY